MAGIGFELRRMLARDSMLSATQAYALASVIGSGPWILSIVVMLLIGLGQFQLEASSLLQRSFQVSVTYVMAASLVLTGPFQLAFTRFAADRLFEHQNARILPNLWGMLLLTQLLAFVLGVLILLLWFQGGTFSILYQISMLCAFVSLSGIWIIISLASAVRQYHRVFLAFVLSYGLTVAAAICLRIWGLQGLVLGFAIGQCCLFFSLLALVVYEFPAQRLLAFDFMNRQQCYPSLMLTGACYSVALWVDKGLFWADPQTGQAVIGALRASPSYDIPIFLSSLTLIPGLAVFLVHLETGVALQCEQFFNTITSGGTLAQVRIAREHLVTAIHHGLLAVVKVQGLATVLAMATAQDVLTLLDLPDRYLPLLKVQLLAVAIELVLLCVLNVLFYLDQRRLALRISVAFVLSNALLSWASLQLPTVCYGYGLLLSALLCSGLALHALWQVLRQLEYQTFMLRPVAL
ncbi:histidine kinase [Rhodoferax lacus]|uniref:Histidine kinase n=1 Tax=Rhodoferax lacus TaxID=2184758 RepID=A0A3E1R665_9BURK|nr:exopolysaccharide Pel transporter PelG [Rhodoferax lacus]RFO94866.1 histidine kinase [Rhodoferax lacus]